MNRFFLFIVFLFSIHISAQTFTIQKKEVTSGTLKHIIVKGTHHSEIPTTILNGKNKGFVLCILSETQNGYSPIYEIQSFINNLDPEEISGTILFMNTDNIKKIPKSLINSWGYLFIIHVSNKYEEILPYVSFYMGKNHDLSGKNRNLAESTQLPYAIITTQKKYNIPVVEWELGNINKLPPSIQNTLEKMFISLKFKEGALFIKNTLIIERYKAIKSRTSGDFHSDLKAGDFVRKGDILGYIVDEHSKEIQPLKAPFAGIILRKKGTSSVSEKENLFTIGMVYM